jgi:tetratricopeptide (TPR) repeat protein
MKFHELGYLKEARKYYSAAKHINSKSNCANDNLKLIKIDELSDEALKLHENHQYIDAGKIYDQILEIDPKNTWAIENKRRLP